MFTMPATTSPFWSRPSRSSAAPGSSPTAPTRASGWSRDTSPELSGSACGDDAVAAAALGLVEGLVGPCHELLLALRSVPYRDAGRGLLAIGRCGAHALHQLGPLLEPAVGH